MGILKNFTATWKAASTAEKVNMIIDVICGFGAGTLGGLALKKIAPDMTKGQKVFAGVTVMGLEMAAGDVAAKALHPFGDAVGLVVDTAKNKMKEEQTNG